IKSLKRALDLDPKFVQARGTLGSAFFMDGDYDECIRQSEMAVELQETFGPAYHNMGLAYLEKKDFAKARENFEKARKYGYEVPEKLLKEAEGNA
ncbi:MAG: tetratricopeptide repeat protein, partial [Desulfovibrionales bacterium]